MRVVPSAEGGEGSGPAVLVVGAGTMGLTHAEAWRALGGRVACVVDRDPNRAAALASPTGAHVCPGVEAAVAAHPEAQVVDVCVPTAAHLPVLRALPTGSYLTVMEKPLGRDPEEAQEAVQVARGRRLDLFVAHVVRFFPEYAVLHREVRSRGAEGVHHLRLRRTGPPPRGVGDWFLDEAQSGGIFLDLMIHDLDWVLWTFGPPQQVMARAGGPDPIHGAPRHAVAVLSYPGRRVVHVEASWMFPGSFGTEVDLNAEWGSLHLGRGEGSLRLNLVEGDGSPVRRETPRRENAYLLELAQAWRAHRLGQPPPVTAEQAWEAVRLASLCRESARTGRILDYPTAPGGTP
jgi:predicted dehydrogenase